MISTNAIDAALATFDAILHNIKELYNVISNFLLLEVIIKKLFKLTSS